MFISLRFTLHREQIPGGIAPQQRSTGDSRRRFKVALISRKHSGYKCASWKAILLVMEHFQKVVPQIWQLGKHICWMGKHTGWLHSKKCLAWSLKMQQTPSVCAEDLFSSLANIVSLCGSKFEFCQFQSGKFWTTSPYSLSSVQMWPSLDGSQ